MIDLLNDGEFYRKTAWTNHDGSSVWTCEGTHVFDGVEEEGMTLEVRVEDADAAIDAGTPEAVGWEETYIF